MNINILLKKCSACLVTWSALVLARPFIPGYILAFVILAGVFTLIEIPGEKII